MNFLAFSKALYSTWIYYSPERVLFDAGEGVATTLSNRIYAVRHVFLTHGHVDHISGLWSIINTRNNAMGDREKPLNVYYPKGNKAVELYIDFLRRVNGDLRFELNFVPLKPFEKVFLRQSGSFTRLVQAFPVQHTASEVSFGYHVIDVRKRLKSEFRGLPQHEIAALVKRLGTETVTETYEKKVVTISGDTTLLRKEDIEGTEILFHECTFFRIEDRKFNNHASLEEVAELVRGTDVKTLVLYHISSRYSKTLQRTIGKLELPGVRVLYVHPDEIFSEI